MNATMSATSTTISIIIIIVTMYIWSFYRPFLEIQGCAKDSRVMCQGSQDWPL
jgi:hypothetical protein